MLSIKGLSLEVAPGEVHAIMGPNGAGKSTLSKVLLGHEAYEITAGSIRFDGVRGVGTGTSRVPCTNER